MAECQCNPDNLAEVEELRCSDLIQSVEGYCERSKVDRLPFAATRRSRSPYGGLLGCHRTVALDAKTPPFGRQTARFSPSSCTRSLRRLAMSLRHPSTSCARSLRRLAMSLRHPPATARPAFGIQQNGVTSFRAILNHVTVSMSARGESQTVRAILNHGDVPQNACIALLRVRGAII